MARARKNASFSAVTSLFIFLAYAGASAAQVEPSPTASGLTQLVETFEGDRPLEGRLTGGFKYVAYDPGRISHALSDETTNPQFFERARIASQVLKEATDDPSAASLHAAGVLHLLWNKPEEAIARLEDARGRDPGNAAILSDLSAAYFTRGRIKDVPYDFILALQIADEATSTDPRLVEAHYNRALALGRLYLPSEAKAAWESYFALDSVSGWATEGRQKLENLVAPGRNPEWEADKTRLQSAAAQGDHVVVREIVTRFPQETRLFVGDELFPDWAAAHRQGRLEEAAETLRGAQAIGEGLREVNGNQMVVRTVAAIASASGGAQPEKLRALVEGHVSFGEAREHYIDFDIAEAQTRFREAEMALHMGDSPFVGWASLYLAICLNLHDEYSQAIERLDKLLTSYGDRDYPSLIGRTYWILGYAQGSRADPAASLDSFRGALHLFERTGESENAVFASMLIAQNLDVLGNQKEAWKYRHRALSGTKQRIGARAAYSIFSEAAEATWKKRLSRIPLYFQNEALRLAESMETPVLLAESFYTRATIHHRLGSEERAGQDLSEAKRFSSRIVDQNERQAVDARIRITEAEILVASQPQLAIQALTETLTLYRDSEFAYLLVLAYAQRARAFMAVGNDELAEADFESAIDESERQREGIPDPVSRASFFEQVQDLFREMVLLQTTRRGRSDVALDYMERGRARLLLDSLSLGLPSRSRGPPDESLTRPMDSATLQRNIPKGVAVIEYMVAKDQLLTWVITGDGQDFVSTAMSEDALRRSVSRLLSMIGQRAGPSELGPVSTELYQTLIEPLLPLLPEDAALVFVPDKFLNNLPFAALMDPETGRFLIQDRVLGVAPSATHHVRAAQRDRELAARASDRALVVANPSFDRTVFPRLSDLPFAKIFGEKIAGLYSESELLAAKQATKRHFLASAPKSDVVHLGGHAIVNLDFPALSRLVLAPTDGHDSGVLYAHELFEQRFETIRLVVLAACSSARTGVWSTEGTGSLAQGFLAAGVPGVVASLWDVGDQAAGELLTRFHRFYRQTGDALKALQSSQNAFLESSDRDLRAPAVWAPFVLIGGGISSDLRGNFP